MANLGLLAFADNDLSETRLWWEKAARNDFAEIKWQLGAVCFELGDRAAARTWWEQAARIGDPEGMIGLGILAEDPRETRAWLERAAANGSHDAIVGLQLVDAECCR